MNYYYFVGVIYIAVVLVVAAKKPRAAMCLCFSLAPVQRALPGLPFKLSIADLNLVLTFAVFAFDRISTGRPFRWGPVALPATFYLIVCAVSSITDWRGESTLVSFVQMIPYLVLAVMLFSSYGRGLQDLRPAFNWLIGVGMFFAISIIASGHAQIYGLSKNGIGSALACIVIVNSEMWLAAKDGKKKRIYLLCLAIMVASLLITLSRGSWMAAIGGLAVILLMRREFKIFAKFSAIMIPVVAICWWALPAENKQFATGFGADRANIHARLAFIDATAGMIQENPVFGVGLGLRKELDATNIILMTLAETGIIGLVAFLLIHVVLVRMAFRARPLISTASWNFSCLAIGTALIMAKLIHGFVDHYWSRGALLMAWAGAGFATRAFYDSQVVITPRAIFRSRPRGPAPRLGAAGPIGHAAGPAPESPIRS